MSRNHLILKLLNEGTFLYNDPIFVDTEISQIICPYGIFAKDAAMLIFMCLDVVLGIFMDSSEKLHGQGLSVEDAQMLSAGISKHSMNTCRFEKTQHIEEEITLMVLEGRKG